MRVIITGGHHTPALAILNELQKRGVHDIHWVGHRYSMWGDRADSAEYRVVSSANIPFYELRAGKVYRTFNPLKLIRVPWGFLQAGWYLLKIKPDLVISFGGYLAVPVVFWAKLLGKLIVTHEQTVTAGLANRVIARLADRIFVSWPQSVHFYPKGKVVVSGNPLRSEIFKTRLDHPLMSAEFEDQVVLYITGGKQGSRVINEAVAPVLDQLLARYIVVHQTGSTTVTNAYQYFLDKKKKLGTFKSKRYFVYDYVDRGEIGTIFARADIVVSRAGANTVSELAALGKPCVLIPIPWVSHNEQYRNARVLAKAGLAVILPEEQLTPQTLLTTIKELTGRLEEYRNKKGDAKKLVRTDAAKVIVDELMKLVSLKIAL